LKLDLTLMTPFDPEMPKGRIVCTAENRGAQPRELPGEYDGGQIMLYGSGLSLHRYRVRTVRAEDIRTVAIQPGEKSVLFDLPLGEILQPRENTAAEPPKWCWNWPKRPSPPWSPIHQYRTNAYLEQATFFVELRDGKNVFRSQSVELHVKQPFASKSSGELQTTSP
jgi:hypothetical protein